MHAFIRPAQQRIPGCHVVVLASDPALRFFDFDFIQSGDTCSSVNTGWILAGEAWACGADDPAHAWSREMETET